MNNILDMDNPELFINLTTPYKNLQKILNFSDVLETNSMYYELEKKFRYSFNNINYSNWIDLTDTNLQYVRIPLLSDFWIEYKYNLISIDTGEQIIFKNILLDVIQDNILSKNSIKEYSIAKQCNSNQSVILNNIKSVYNPYDYGSGSKIYEDLSSMVNDIIGLEVDYYKTNSIISSEDVILGEYSLSNVVAKKCIKVIPLDNTMPSNEIMFNSIQGLGMQDLFEIHVVRRDFENIFGIGSRPITTDYILFKHNNKIYDVNSVSIPDENAFSTRTYYKINLKEHSIRANRYDDDDIGLDLRNLYSDNQNIIEEKIMDERKQITNPVQYTIKESKNYSSDYYRKYLDKNVKFIRNKIVNPETYEQISLYQYDLSNVKNIAVKYDGFNIDTEFAFTFMFNGIPSIKYKNVDIRIKTTTNYSDDIYNDYCLIETELTHSLKEFDYIHIKNSKTYDGYSTVLKVIDDYRFLIDREYNGYLGGNIDKKSAYNKLYENEHFKIDYCEHNLKIQLDENIYIINYEFNTDWNYFVLNYSYKFNQVSIFIYRDLKLVHQSVYNNDLIVFTDNNLSLYGTKDFRIGNMRLFNTLIEEDEQIKILSQESILDAKYLILADDCREQIKLEKHSGR